jgi:glucokinase
MHAISADIGGSHISAALVDLERKIIIENSLVRHHVNASGTIGQILAAWCDCINGVSHFLPRQSFRLSLAMPGPFDCAHGISLINENAKYDALYKVNVKTLLSEELDISPRQIRMKNDAASFLAGEVTGGCAVGFRKVIGITLGTGVGSAFYVNGESYDAERWRIPFRGSLAEDFISTRWFVQRFLELSGLKVAGVREIVELGLRNGNVKRVFHEFAVNLANFLHDFYNEHHPDAIVIGGNIAQAADYFLPETIRWLHEANVRVPVLKSTLGEKAAILGAASTWMSTVKSFGL